MMIDAPVEPALSVEDSRRDCPEAQPLVHLRRVWKDLRGDTRYLPVQRWGSVGRAATSRSVGAYQKLWILVNLSTKLLAVLQGAPGFELHDVRRVKEGSQGRLAS